MKTWTNNGITMFRLVVKEKWGALVAVSVTLPECVLGQNLCS